jgi:hypothetical protein
MKSIKKVSFFGSSKGTQGDPNFDAAQQTAKAVALMGITVVNGGGDGVMRAATFGAKQGNGKTEVVYYDPDLATDYEGPSIVNLADVTHKEANYIERTRKLLELGDAYIIFNGGTGTISEFGMAWGLAKLYFGHHKPLILFGDFWHNIISEFTKRMRIGNEELSVLTIVTKVEEATDAIIKYDELLLHNRSIHKACRNGECRFIL